MGYGNNVRPIDDGKGKKAKPVDEPVEEPTPEPEPTPTPTGGLWGGA